MQLTTHFSLEEFCSSDIAARMGIAITPSTAEADNLRRLCEVLLEPIRIQLGRPMVVTSGLRPQWLNDLIGGSKTSAHMEGRAADIKVVGMSSPTFARWIRAQGFPADQVINEFDQWVHIGMPKASDKPRLEYLTATHTNGTTLYEALI